MEGYIFNIQKFSLHDGPGIRTTIFFKGCNLHCAWCANPESQQLHPQTTLDAQKCLGCMACVIACASGARLAAQNLPKVDFQKCTGCGACVQACPAQAIGLEGRRVSVQDVLQEALKDKPFYDQSGGGVSFSGGEVLLQQEFATALARELHAHGVHVAIETAAAVPEDQFQRFLKEIDYVFMDLKHYDDARHREGTGIGNGKIIANLRSLIASGLDYTVRIPVIPNYNDAIADAHGFASLLKELGAAHVQLLPFHQLGERKYQLLHRDYAYAGKPQLHREDLQNYRNIFMQYGIEAQL